jgi:hypothetical protein
MPQSQQFTPTPEIRKTPTSIGSLEIILARGFGEIIPELPGNPEKIQQAALFDNLAVRDQNGAVMDWKRGDLTPFLTPQEISGLIALMDRLWALAEQEILP